MTSVYVRLLQGSCAVSSISLLARIFKKLPARFLLDIFQLNHVMLFTQSVAEVLVFGMNLSDTGKLGWIYVYICITSYC